MVDKSCRTHKEAIKTVLLVQFLKTVKNTAYHIVSAGSLTAGENDTYIKRLFHSLRLVIVLELNDRHSVCVGESLFDFRLICHRLCSLSEFNFDIALKIFGQFGLILCSYSLECTLFHVLF